MRVLEDPSFAPVFARGGIGAAVIAVAVAEAQIDALLHPRAHDVFGGDEIQGPLAVGMVGFDQSTNVAEGGWNRWGHVMMACDGVEGYPRFS